MRNIKSSLVKLVVVAGLVLMAGGVLWLRTSREKIQGETGWTEAPDALHQVKSEKAGSTAIELEAVAANPKAAQVKIGGGVRILAPNVRGEYPRVRVPASAMIGASVPFPEAEPGEVIPVQAEDGGLLQGAAASGSVVVEANRRAAIDYQVSAYDGLHRVTLRRGGESRVLEFWVGAEPPVVVRK